MALSSPPQSIPERELYRNASSKKLPVPLEVNIAGQNLKITDINELVDLNKINGNCGRINTLTIKTVSTYKKKLDFVNSINSEEQLNENKQVEKRKNLNEFVANQNLPVNCESAAVLKSDKINLEKKKLEQYENKTIDKLNNKNQQFVNNQFLRNTKSSSSLRQQNLFTKFGNLDLKENFNRENNLNKSINLEYKYPENKQNFQEIKKPNYQNKINFQDTNRINSQYNKESYLNNKDKQSLDSEKKKFYFDGKNSFKMYNNQVDKICVDLNDQKISANAEKNLKNSQQINTATKQTNLKDGNNNSNNVNRVDQSKQKLNEKNRSNSERYSQMTQQVDSVKKNFSRSYEGEEINKDFKEEFVLELKNKIANNNQTTSSPAASSKMMNFSSNSLGKEKKRHLILDTNTMPNLNRKNERNLIKSTSLKRNESFQQATENHRIQMEPRKNKQNKNINPVKQSNTLYMNTETDKLDGEMIANKRSQRYSFVGSQAINGYQPENNRSNENIANETCTTDDWNTTVDTNLETKSTDDRSKQFKKCDKYGFFVKEENNENSKKLSKKEEEHLKKLSLEADKRREMKWLEMLQNWDKFMQKKWSKICERCRKGIPPSLRGTAWFHLSAAHKQKRIKPELFKLLNQQEGDKSVNDEIIRDLHRQFPNHEMFAGINTEAQQDLFALLKNFSIIKPDIAYSQGEAPIACVLLMHLPVEDAFWCLWQLSDHYLPGYFSPCLDTIQMHGIMLNSFLKRVNNTVYKILKKQKIDPTFYMTEWFMCVFARTLPWPTVLRIWDMFFCEGIKIVFRVALVILNSLEADFKKAKCNTNDKLVETMEILKNLPKKYLEIDYLLPKVIEMNVSEKDLETEHCNVMKKLKKKKK